MPSNNVALEAVFSAGTTYTLTVTANPSIGGSVTDGGNYTAGASVPVTASAATGYTFVNWTVDGKEVSTVASFNYTMPANAVALVANFDLNPVGNFDFNSELSIKDVFELGAFYNITYTAVLTDITPEDGIDEIMVSGSGITTATTTVTGNSAVIDVNSTNQDNSSISVTVTGYKAGVEVGTKQLQLFNPIRLVSGPVMTEQTMAYYAFEATVEIPYTEIDSIADVVNVVGADFYGFRYNGAAASSIAVQHTPGAVTTMTFEMLFSTTPVSAVIRTNDNAVELPVTF